jgi:hypothetical protein
MTVATTPGSLTPADVQRIANAVRTAQFVEVKGAAVSSTGEITLDFEVDNLPLKIEFHASKLIVGDLKRLESRPANLRGRYNRMKADNLTVRELKERGLPLYWNRNWLTAQFARLGSYSAIAREFGYPSATTIGSYAKRKFGMDVQGEFDRKREEVIKEFDETRGQAVYAELAEKHKVAVATIYRWLAEHRGRELRKTRAFRKPSVKNKPI